MNAGPAITKEPVAGIGLGRPPLRPWRDLWAFDQNERLVLLAQSALGKLVLVTAFMAASLGVGLSLPYVIVAAAFAYWPAYRNWILITAGLVGLARSSGIWLNAVAPVLVQEGVLESTGKVLVLSALAVYFVGAWAVLGWVRQHPNALMARRPVLSMLGITVLLGVLASGPLLHGGPRVAAWAFLSVFTAYLWYFAYAVQDQRSRSPGPLSFQIGIFHPFWRSSGWSFTPTPFGKGAAFLRKHQAKTSEELAVTQLKALKLLVWAGLLTVLNTFLLHLVHERLAIPITATAFAAFLEGKPFPISTNWASLTWAALGGTLGLAILGHKLIAVARLAGFRLPRNTWRPLEARTLAEFWNRYYYYFKELLVEFFFFPTFLRVFRKHPRLRVFFATFMAAGVGNALYHFVRDLHLVTTMGWEGATTGFTSYLVYCTALAMGIGISQARVTAGRTLPDTWAGRLWCALCIWSFFVCLQVFGDETRAFPLMDRIEFFTSLFGIS